VLQRALDEEAAAFLSRARYFAHADGDRFAYREAAETDPDCRSEISVAMPQVKAAYWAALEEATDPARCRTTITQPRRRTGASLAECRVLPGGGPGRTLHPSQLLPTRSQAAPVLQFVGAFTGGSEAAQEGDRALPRRNQLAEHVLGSARLVLGWRQRAWPDRPGVQTR